MLYVLDALDVIVSDAFGKDSLKSPKTSINLKNDVLKYGPYHWLKINIVKLYWQWQYQQDNTPSK